MTGTTGPAAGQSDGPVTIVDVALASGYSSATVSRVLGGHPHVSDGARTAVHAAVAKLGYVPNQIAVQLRSGETRAVILMVPTISGWSNGQLLAGAERELTSQGYRTFVRAVTDAAGFRRTLETTHLRGKVDGTVLIDLMPDDEAMKLVSVPAVSAGATVTGLASVAADELLIGADATRHLLALGHTRIGAIHWRVDRDHRAALRKRLSGYRQALRESGIEPDPGLEIEVEGPTAEHGVEAAKLLIGMADPPTAVVALSDYLGVGVFHTYSRLGFDLPRDLSIIGIDDHPLALVFGLTTMVQPARELGAMAARKLIDQLRGGGRQMSEVRPARLVIRESTAEPRPTREPT